MDFICGTTLVHLKIRCWSGEKKASRDRDIQMGSDGKMPPEKLLDLGRKKIFPPKAIDPLTRQRKAAERACLAVGTRFMGGYAIPDDDVEDLLLKLDDINSKFDESLTEFMSAFESNLQAWLDENLEYEHIFRDQLPDRDSVERAFGFSFGIYKLQPRDGFEPDEDEVANQILHEIGITCKEMSNRMLDRRTAISGKKLKEQLEPLIKKLDTLSFGNGRMLTVLNEFRALHNSVPLERIDHEHAKFGQTLTFLSMCGDSDKLERIIDGRFSVNQLISNIQNSGPDIADSSVTPVIQTAITSTSVASGAYF